jgi:hypothetical protein
MSVPLDLSRDFSPNPVKIYRKSLSLNPSPLMSLAVVWVGMPGHVDRSNFGMKGCNVKVESS